MLIDIHEASRDLIEARERLGPAVYYRLDLWERLKELALPATATPSQRLDAATVERNLEAQRQTIEACARVADRMEGGLNIAGAIRRLSPNEALATEPHQHGGKGA